MAVFSDIRLILKKINELNPFAGTVLSGEELIPIYDPATGKTVKVKASLFTGGEDKTLQWVSTETYAINEIRTWNLKFWKSLVDANIGNQPVEGTYWTEVSKSETGNLGYWAAGVFTNDPSYAVYNQELYLLDNTAVTIPYESSDFAAELALGYWLKVGISQLQSDRIDSYPDFPAIPEGKVLSDDRTFKTMAVAVGGFASNIYFSQTDSDITGYKSQTANADAVETVITPTVSAAEGDKLLYQYLYAAAVEAISIPSGVWSFDFTYFVNSANGVTQLGVRPFRYTQAGVKEYIFSAILWSEEIDNTVRGGYKTLASIQSEITIVETDRLGCDLYIKTTSVAAITVNIVIGDGSAAFMNSPLPVRHSVLRDKNGEADFQHITLTEKNALNEHINGVDEAKHGANQVVNAAALPNLGLPINSKQSVINAAIPAPGGGSYTYAQLLALKTAGDLVRGVQYELNDYYTKHLIPNSSPAVIHTGTLEPLLLTAVSSNEFHIEAKSTLFPTDIIRYRFDDDSCEDGTRDALNKKWTGGTARPGYITYRRSTTNNIEVHNDWRNYKVRRWKLDCAAWVSADSYTKMEVVKGSDGNIYVAKTTHTGLTVDPTADTTNWQLAFDLTIQASGGFLSYTSVKADFTVGGITPTNLIINNATAGTDYQDYYQFCILSELTNSTGLLIADTFGTSGQGFNGYSIGGFDFDDFNLKYGNGNDLQSNVFYLVADGGTEIGLALNKIGANSTYNTFEGVTYDNEIGLNYHSNIIEPLCIFNKIYSGNLNVIGSDFNLNKMNRDLSKTIIGSHCNLNVTNNLIYASIIDTHFELNKIEAPIQNEVFTAATHVYGDYNCTIFKNAAGVARLSYYDASDVLTIVNITA